MHRKIPLSPQFPTAATPKKIIVLKGTYVAVLPNGNLVDKDAVIGKADFVSIDRNTIIIITPCNNIRRNNILLRIYGKGNLCLMVLCTLIEIQEWLQSNDFLQVHDSFIINKQHAAFISPHIEIYLSEIIIPIGRKHSKKVDKAFQSQMNFKPTRSHHKKVESLLEFCI